MKPKPKQIQKLKLIGRETLLVQKPISSPKPNKYRSPQHMSNKILRNFLHKPKVLEFFFIL